MDIHELALEDIELLRPVHDSVFEEKFKKEDYIQKLKGKPHLILVAKVRNKIVGFKVGYERDGGFYSWLSGVLEEHRRKGIATKLADVQEKWAHEHGFSKVWFKTYDQFKAVQLFARKRGFSLVDWQFSEKRNKVAMFFEKKL